MAINHAKGKTLYVRSMGKALRVTGMFVSDDEANDWLKTHEGHGVVAMFGPIVLTANMYDRGIDLPAEPA